jgi:hypothetical protein
MQATAEGCGGHRPSTSPSGPRQRDLRVTARTSATGGCRRSTRGRATSPRWPTINGSVGAMPNGVKRRHVSARGLSSLWRSQVRPQ